MDRVVTFTDFLSQLVHSCIKWTAEKGGNFPTHSILLGKELLQIDNLCRITVVMPYDSIRAEKNITEFNKRFETWNQMPETYFKDYNRKTFVA